MSELDKIEPVANCDRFQTLKHSSSLPFAFTEQGVSMLSAVLKSQTAIKTSIQIINSFVKMRQFLSQNADIFKQLELVKKWFVFSLLEVESFQGNFFVKAKTANASFGLMGRVCEVVEDVPCF